MKTIYTLSRQKPFQYKRTTEGEIIVYASDKKKRPQDREALIITPWTVSLVKKAIGDAGDIVVGASRDKPPADSLGALLKKHKQSPQQLSYLTAILVHEGFCKAHTGAGGATVLRRVG